MRAPSLRGPVIDSDIADARSLERIILDVLSSWRSARCSIHCLPICQTMAWPRQVMEAVGLAAEALTRATTSGPSAGSGLPPVKMAVTRSGVQFSDPTQHLRAAAAACLACKRKPSSPPRLSTRRRTLAQRQEHCKDLVKFRVGKLHHRLYPPISEYSNLNNYVCKRSANQHHRMIDVCRETKKWKSAHAATLRLGRQSAAPPNRPGELGAAAGHP